MTINIPKPLWFRDVGLFALFQGWHMKAHSHPATPTDSNISIAHLLDSVNRNFPDVLPEDVLRRFGHEARPDGTIGKDAL